MDATPAAASPAPEPPPSSRKAWESRLVFLLLIIAVNLAVFLPSMSGDFLWDDKYFISENPNILGSGFLRSFLSSPFGGFSGSDENSQRQDRIMQFYRPLVSLSYWLDFNVWGLNPAAFHLTNILLHIINVIILFYILSGLAFGPRPAFFGAVLFSVYPLHFENVSWISGRTDLLAFLFAGLATLFFIRFMDRPHRLDLPASAAAFFLALLCKENAVILPLIFSFFLYKKNGRSRLAASLGPYGLAFIGWFLLRWNALGAASAGASGRTVLDFLATIGYYGWKTVFPFKLSLTIDSFPVIHSALYRLLGAGMLAALGLSIWQGLRKSLAQGRPYWTYMSYALLVLPSGLVVLSAAAISLLAWRFLYLASAVFIGALAWLFESRLRPRALASAALLLLTALYTGEIYPKNSQFGHDEAAFWLSIKNPGREDALARFNIAVKTLPADEKKALALFETILSRPGHPLHGMLKTRIYEELAMFYAYKRDFSRAESYFNELFRTEGTQSLHSYFNYAYYLGLSGKKEDGEHLIRRLLGQFPRNHNALVRAAKFYLIVRDYDQAAGLYAEDFRLFRTRQSRLLAEEAARLARKTPS
ncbi:MAG: hypothetical protein A2W03_11615 [Candidatus Aminicenantes bacterium RBG_16_63_16]|nr:MAG: hypothetical protein A2W03_11615 [Candidatus Aminicenantes bacterium RBG_16_63_16]